MLFLAFAEDTDVRLVPGERQQIVLEMPASLIQLRILAEPAEHLREHARLDRSHLDGAVSRAKHLIDPAESLAEGRVEMVLDGVVGAAGQVLGDFGPLVAALAVLQEDYVLLLFRPWPLADRGVQVVVPAFPALLAGALLQPVPLAHALRHFSPPLRAQFLYQLNNSFVLLTTVNQEYLGVKRSSVTHQQHLL
jgi:hypothetical protein